MEKVSVIITSYGKPDTLSRAIRSVQRQSYENLEIIVVDDNDAESSYREETARLMAGLADPRIIYLQHEKNRNGAAARNTGLQAANGAYIAFLDNDDLYLKDRIRNAVDYLSAHEDIGGVCCAVLVMNNFTPKYVHRIRLKESFFRDYLQDLELLGTGSNIFLRRSTVSAVGLFDTSFQRHQDVEYMLRVAHTHSLGILPSVDVVKINLGLHRISYVKLKSGVISLQRSFAELIEQVAPELAHSFWEDRYTILLRAAISEGDPAQLREAIALLKPYRGLTAEEEMLLKRGVYLRWKGRLKECLLRSKPILALKKQISLPGLSQMVPAEAAGEIRELIKE